MDSYPQEKIKPGQRILITTKEESLADSSLVRDAVVSQAEAAGAVVISTDSDHAGAYQSAPCLEKTEELSFCCCLYAVDIVIRVI